MSNRLEALIFLSGVPNLYPVKIKQLVEYFGSPENVVNASYTDLCSFENKSFAEEFIRFKDKFDPKKEENFCKYNGIDLVTIYDKNYPSNLKLLSDPPFLIYIKGKFLENKDNIISIVGTRKPSAYGKLVIERLLNDLAEYNICTISGLAYGIDTYVHEYSLRNEIKTFAVLGNGICVYYPRANMKLQKVISQKGALISEFPCYQNPTKMSFPQRNRLIAALSLATIVIEADYRSGALITANFACDLGKEVFAVPGSIFSKNSNGTNYLIKNGARILTSSIDLIEILSLKKRIKIKNTFNNKELDISNLLDKNKKMILEILSKKPTGMHIDELQSITNLKLSKLFNILLQLELSNKVKSMPGKIYILTGV